MKINMATISAISTCNTLRMYLTNAELHFLLQLQNSAGTNQQVLQCLQFTNVFSGQEMARKCPRHTLEVKSMSPQSGNCPLVIHVLRHGSIGLCTWWIKSYFQVQCKYQQHIHYFCIYLASALDSTIPISSNQSNVLLHAWCKHINFWRYTLILIGWNIIFS